MIKILYRYIITSTLLTTFLIILMMLGLIFFINLLGELKSIGTGDYHLLQAMIYIFLRLPHELYRFLPMLILLGGITGLGMIAAHKELIVMRTSGVSLWQIAYAELIAAFLVVLIITLLGELLAPPATYFAAVRKENAQNSGQAVITRSGVWIHEQNNFFHVQQIVDRRRLENVAWYQFDNEHRMKATYFAQYVDRVGGAWLAHDIEKTTFSENKLTSQHTREAKWNLNLNSSILNIGLIEADEMSLSRLRRYIHYLKQNGLQANEYRFEFWQRVFQPLAAFIMILLAIPFVLSLRGPASIGWRILGGIIVGFGFYIANAMLGQVTLVAQIPPWFAALLPILLFGAVSIFMLKMAAR